MAEKLLTVAQAAKELTLGRSSLYDLIKRRQIRFLKIGAGGAGLRIPESAVGEFLKRREFGVVEPEAAASVPAARYVPANF